MEVEEGDGGSGSGSAAAALEAAERRRLEEEEEEEDEDEEAFLPPFFLELEVEGSLLAMVSAYQRISVSAIFDPVPNARNRIHIQKSIGFKAGS